MIRSELIIPKVWRSELRGVILFLVFCILSLFLTAEFPGSVIKGKLFDIGNSAMMLDLPLWWFIPFGALIRLVFRIYNVRYSVDSRGVEARVGILALHQRVTRVRYEDIRSIELEQSILERILDVGSLEISTAATGTVEIIFQGVAAPHEVQDMLQRERDSRQQANHGISTAKQHRKVGDDQNTRITA